MRRVIRRSLAAPVLLAILGLRADAPRITFLHPKRTVVLATPHGVEIPVQARVPRDPDNRAFRLTWDGDSCQGEWSHTLDGEDESILHPIEPIRVRLFAGVCTFRAAVYGPGDTLRDAALLDVRVCDGAC